MSTPTTYPFTKQANLNRLTLEIQQSPIVTVLDHMDLTGTDLTITFKDALSSADQTTLNSLVVAHVNTPLPNPIQTVAVTSQPQPYAFAAKIFAGKGLFKRVVGISQTVTNIGANTMIYSSTFPWSKFIGIEIINGEPGDTASLYVLDDANGTYSKSAQYPNGFPNVQLNQFGFNVNIPSGYYISRSEFDADLYIGMQLKLVFTTANISKFLGINFILNELK